MNIPMTSKSFRFKNLVCILLMAVVSTQLLAKTDQKLQQIIQGQQRSAAHKARDVYRHPYATLKFFGLTDNMILVEITPGGGWYTEILAPYLKQNGQYIAASYDIHSKSDYYRTNAEKFEKKLKADPISYSKTQVTVMQLPDSLDFAKANCVDMVVSFRNVHNWSVKGNAGKVFTAIYKSLKPGGVFGLVQHRAGDQFPKDKKGSMGYVSQKALIKVAEKAGFKLVATSEINANPKDIKNYSKGVWTLPPVFRLKEVDKAKFLAIGESDRMTLKFIKPTNK